MAAPTTPTPTAPDDLSASLKALLSAAQTPGVSPTPVMGGQAADPVMAGLDAYRETLGRRTPPQYDAALAALQRAIY